MTLSHDTTNLAIAGAVDHLRRERDLTVDQLAVYAGLNRASLYRKLKGEFGWKATDIAALSRYFGVQPNDLFSGSPIGGLADEDVKRPTLVRHQGLEPRTRWLTHNRRSRTVRPGLVSCGRAA